MSDGEKEVLKFILIGMAFGVSFICTAIALDQLTLMIISLLFSATQLYLMQIEIEVKYGI